MTKLSPQPDLNEVLVLTVRKGFWASSECEIFPHRLYAQPLAPFPGRFGSTRNPLNVLTLAINGYLECLRRRPRLILFGSAPRLSAWFAWLKQTGLLPPLRMIAPGAFFLPSRYYDQFERLYVFSRGEIPPLAERFIFLPLPGPERPLPIPSAGFQESVESSSPYIYPVVGQDETSKP